MLLIKLFSIHKTPRMESYISEANHVLSFYGNPDPVAGALGISNCLCSILTSSSRVAPFGLLGDEGR
jgi:hypothetical protein